MKNIYTNKFQSWHELTISKLKNQSCLKYEQSIPLQIELIMYNITHRKDIITYSSTGQTKT